MNRPIEYRSNAPEVERRVIGEGCELRAEERADGKLIISGYAVRFNQDSVDMGGWHERIKGGAFAGVLATTPDVRCLFNHDPSAVLGRTKSGTLKLFEDESGLRMECEIPNTAAGRPIFESIKRGDITGQSFSFRVAQDGAEWNDDWTQRTVTSVGELFDVGPVTFPAYPSTDIATRSRDEAMQQAAETRRQQAPDGAKHGKPNPENKPPAKGQNRGHNTMTITERRAHAKKLVDDAQKLLAKGAAENRESTAEERSESKRLMDEADGHREQAALEERAAQLAAEAAREPDRRSEAPPTGGPPPTERPIIVRPFATTRNFKPTLFGTTERALDAAYRSGMFILGLFGNERAASWCRENGMEYRAQGGSTNTKGGYLVPHELSSAVIALMEEYGVARRLSRIFQMGSDKLSVPIRAGGVTAYAVGENAEITPSDKEWGMATLSASKFAALVKYSSEISEDAVINLADDLAQEIAWAFAQKEDDAMINGDGTSGYHGIVGILNALLAGSKKEAATSENTFAKITAGSITKTMGALPGYAKAGTSILTAPVVGGAVFDRLLIGAGGNTNAQLAAGQPKTFNGKPIVESDLMPDEDGASEKVALIGNFAQAVAFGDRRAITLRVLTERYAELDQLAVMGTERFDINVHQKGTTSKVGPVVLFSTAS